MGFVIQYVYGCDRCGTRLLVSTELAPLPAGWRYIPSVWNESELVCESCLEFVERQAEAERALSSGSRPQLRLIEGGAA